MSKSELKRGYSVRFGSGQPEFDSLQFLLRHIFFFGNIFFIGRPNINDFKLILELYIYFYFIISLLSSYNFPFMRSKLITNNNVSHGQNSTLCITILLVKFRAIHFLSLKLSSLLSMNIN